MCFCCQHCRRKLSLLNYAVFQEAFYCKICCKLLAGVVGKSPPNPTLSPNRQQLLQKDTQLNPRRESKNKNSPTGRILAREKMPPRFSNLHPQGSLSDKPKTICSPLKKDVKGDIGRKYDRYGTKKTWLQDPAMVLRSSQQADASHYKTWEDKSIAESSRVQKKKSQLPKVTSPKSGDHILHWVKKVHGSQDLGVLENRQLFVDGGIVGVEVGKIGSSILEKVRRFQSDSFKVERSISKASSLSLNLPRSSLASSFLSPDGGLRSTTVTPVATTAGAPQLAKDPFQGKKPSGASSWKATSDGKNQRQILPMVEPLPKVRTTLPALAPPVDNRSKKKLQRATQENTLNTVVTEDTEELNSNNMAPMKNKKPSPSKPEGLVSSPGYEEKGNNQTEHSDKTLASNFDPMKSCLKTNQEHKPSWISRNEFLGEAIEILHPERQPSMDSQLSPETHPLMNEEVKKNEMYPRGTPDSFGSLTCTPDLDSQNTEPKDTTSSSATDGDIEDGSSLSSSQPDDVENREVLPRNNLQEDAALICNIEPPIKITNTNEKLPAKASSEHNLQLAFQEDTSRDTSLLASVSYTKDPEILLSCEVPCLIEKQETGQVTVEIKAQNGKGSVIETSQDITDKSARKQPLKKQNNPFAQFFASKTQRSVPNQKLTSGTKKAPKSALVTLFGHSVNKDKSQKEWPRKDLGELSGKVSLQSTHYSNLPKPDSSKKEENSKVVIQTMNSGAGPQESEESHRSCSKENQNGNSPSLDCVNTFSLELGRDIASPIGMPSRTKSLDIPRQSNLNTENTAKDHGQSLPFTSLQDCLVSTENMSQYSTNPSVETSVSCRNPLSEQGLYKFSNLANVDSQDLELKARNVSLLDPLREDETQALDEVHQVPDTLLSFKGVEGSANMERDAAETSPGLDSEIVQTNDDFCSGSSENYLQVSSPQFSELELNVGFRDDSLSNRQPPETGNPQTFGSNSDHPFELTLHVEQASNEDYSIGENHLHPVLTSFPHMPELLRDTLQGKATERSVEAKSLPED
ncbi:uncharacterized protein LOC112540949 [Python bivittatus]|uniref:Uncharacterized protein LOC112540949 n=1 Tax=Python bivittatus TaxID=176946 RepID=A0A9F5N117_PYTBI|nr:uncharacterized protein LOC112540949 [Python bivittatus]